MPQHTQDTLRRTYRRNLFARLRVQVDVASEHNTKRNKEEERASLGRIIATVLELYGKQRVSMKSREAFVRILEECAFDSDNAVECEYDKSNLIRVYGHLDFTELCKRLYFNDEVVLRVINE